MCGIAGVWRAEPLLEESELRELCAALAHRGPDGGGIWLHPSRSLGFAHRRLAIVDLSDAAVQPMQSASGRTCIVFNGEIYNFRELRQRAMQCGWRFRSESDTEVILALYEQLGSACVERFRGMFAFALWDEAEQRLWLVRDRLGIKPLYYYWDGTCFAFASELRALQRIAGFRPQVDVTALWDFFTYHYIPPPKSIYRYVRKLEAGSWLWFNVQQRSLTLQRYWSLPQPTERPLTEEQALTELDELLSEVVAEHLVADVPVGAFLSGGVDSSLVVAYARRRQPLRAFTVAFDVAAKNEQPYAEAVARCLGVEQRSVPMTAAEFLPSVEHFVRTYGEPFGDTSGIAVMALARVARAELKAVLSGDGGDELFGGYIRRASDLGLHWCPLRSARVVPWLLQTLPTRRGERWLQLLLPPSERVVHTAAWFQSGQKRRLFSSDISALLPQDYDDIWFLRRSLRPGLSPLRQRLYMDLETWLPEKMLTKVDRASMAVGLEVRVPLLDHRLVEWVCRVPESLLWTPQRGGKWLLKRLLEREVPAPLVYRPKKGFSIPLTEWVQRGQWEQRIRQSRFWREGVFHRELFRRADLRSPVTAFLLLVLAVWSDDNPWVL
jgi:asparagine synthase (glutamine-hydrolysing)